MDWWNEFVNWLTSTEGRSTLFTAAILVISIIVAAVIAASITKAAIRRLVGQRDRELRSSAIAALVDASTEAAVWSSLTPGEQVLADRAVGQADIFVRLLPVKGAALAANWASHQLTEMKRQSATFGYELGPIKSEFRDRLIEWQNRPNRAKKIFESDLARWQFETSDSDKALVAEQDAWINRQHREKFQFTTESEASTASLPSAQGAATEATSTPVGDPETQRLIEDVAAMDVPRRTDETERTRDAS